MAITQYASPEYRYSDYDTEIMEDYDNRIGTYNKALTEFQALAEPYQGLVDTYNTQIGTYNTDLGAYKADADAYNAAIAEYNAGPRTEEYAGVASPGQFTGVVPIFEGGAAPVAPEDPGFSGEDVDAFMKTANERAQQSGAANATTLAVMNDPTQTYRTAAVDVNLAGMSGFGSTAMGFADGGQVQSPFADPMSPLGPMGEIKGQQMLQPSSSYPPPQISQPLAAEFQAPQAMVAQVAAPIQQVEQFDASNGGIGGMFEQLQQARDSQTSQPLMSKSFEGLQGLGGIGGQFEQMNQMRNQMGQQFGQQMAGMQGAPLENYKNYLNQVYTAPEMQSATAALGGALEGRVEEFVGMVDEAERAHFDAEESYGFGGGDFQKGLMSQFENQSQAPMERMQTQQLGGIGGMMGQMGMFADGGMVGARPPERGPNPQATFEEGGEVQDPKANMRLALEKLSDPQILEMYGIKREELAGNLAMLEAQEYQQNPYESIPQMPV